MDGLGVNQSTLIDRRLKFVVDRKVVVPSQYRCRDIDRCHDSVDAFHSRSILCIEVSSLHSILSSMLSFLELKLWKVGSRA